MSVVSVKEIGAPVNGYSDVKLKRTYVREFQVTTDSWFDGPWTAMGAAGVPKLFTSYTDPNGGGDPGAILANVQATRNPEDWFDFKVACNYDSQPGGSPIRNQPDPVQRPPLIRFESVTVMEAASFAYKVWNASGSNSPPDLSTPNDTATFYSDGSLLHGVPIINSAKQHFDPPPLVERTHAQLVYIRNELNINLNLPVMYAGRLNSAPWCGAPMYAWKCNKIGYDEQFENNQVFFQVTYIFDYNPTLWLYQPLDQGWCHLDSTPKLVPNVAGAGQLQQQQLLDGTGKVLPLTGSPPVFNGTPQYWKYQLQPAVSFNSLGLF